ncbi:MAG: YVTN family beta-propeller protein [Flammeovirgaceae bacterium]|jgi:YVTN family beta-propeller protein
MFKFLRFTVFAFLAVSLFSCDDDEPGLPAFPEEGFTNGVFVINEGNFGTPNGSISFYERDSMRVSSKIFQTVNNKIVLGDVIQSVNIFDEKGFIVVNNSNRVEIVEAKTFKSLATLTNVRNPRYLTKVSENQAYISNWGNFGSIPAYVSVLDLTTNTIIDSIGNTSFTGLEEIAVKDGKAYVSNNFGSTISVINVNTNTVEKHIKVFDTPKSVKLINNEIWVLCKGSSGVSFSDPNDDTQGGLVRISTVSDTVEQTLPIGNIGQHPGIMETDGTSIFYTFDSKTYKMETTASALPTSALISSSFYGLGIDSKTGNIFGGNANGFTATGTVDIYNSTGTKLNTFQSVGIGPNGFVFVD